MITNELKDALKGINDTDARTVVSGLQSAIKASDNPHTCETLNDMKRALESQIAEHEKKAAVKMLEDLRVDLAENETLESTIGWSVLYNASKYLEKGESWLSREQRASWLFNNNA